MLVEWKVDVYSAGGSAVGAHVRSGEPSGEFKVSTANMFKPVFRSIDRNANVVVNSKAIAELTRAAIYSGLFDALAELHHLDDEDPAALDGDTFDKASVVLSLLASRQADPPKIFSHGGDAAVFTWTERGGMKYITVSGGCAVFARRDKGSKPFTVGVADMSESNSVELLPSLGVIRDSSSTNPVR